MHAVSRSVLATCIRKPPLPAPYSTFANSRYKRGNTPARPPRRVNPGAHASRQPQSNGPDQELPSSFLQEVDARGTGDIREGLSTLLSNDKLLIERQIEMLNIFVGFEQANKYAITNENGESVGFIAEEDQGILSMFRRQMFRTHRPFRAVVMDRGGNPLLLLQRPFAWINSRMTVARMPTDTDAPLTSNEEASPDLLAEVHQRWHPWRRRYELFLRSQHNPLDQDISFEQFANVDSPILAWHFLLHGRDGAALASIDRAFRGFGREIFTDTGQYTIDFRPESQTLHRPLSLEERALIFGLAVNIDVDYFSRHSHSGGFGGLWMFSSWE